MNFRKTYKVNTLGLMRGIDVPQPEYKYFLELEVVGPGENFRRSWFYLDELCQKNHSHIPEETKEYTKRVKRTRNHKLCKLLYDKQGITVERETMEVED